VKLPCLQLLFGSTLAFAWGWLGSEVDRGPASLEPQLTGSSTADQLSAMSTACSTWLSALSVEQRKQASFALDAPDRKRWSNLPMAMFQRSGVCFAEMGDEQRVLAHRFLQSALSEQGYARALGIMQIDDVLADLIPEVKNGYSAGHYWLSVFGEPGSADWGWQLDGHHLALNFSVKGEQLHATPMFLGINPAEVQSGPFAGTRVLGVLEDRMHAALASLDPEERELARLAEASPGDVMAGPAKRERMASEIAGFDLASGSAEQQRAAVQAMHAYRDTIHPALRGALPDQEAAWFEDLHLGWAQAKADEAFYLRLHGKQAWLEWSDVNGVGRGRHVVNHVHAIWRDPAGDYGEAKD